MNKSERTLVVIKPDGIQRSLIGEIIKRYERTGLRLTAMKMTVPQEDMVETHYSTDPNWKTVTGQKAIDAYKKKGLVPPSENPLEVGNIIIGKLKKYLAAGPVIAMVWQGMNAVGIVRKVTGGTEPLTSDVGTIRGDFTIDSYQRADSDERAVRNLIHASGSPEEAEKEIALWFNEGEIINYKLAGEAILYDVNLDGILE